MKFKEFLNTDTTHLNEDSYDSKIKAAEAELSNLKTAKKVQKVIDKAPTIPYSWHDMIADGVDIMLRTWNRTEYAEASDDEEEAYALDVWMDYVSSHKKEFKWAYDNM